MLRDHLGMTGLRKMLLRPGDFIEDKFGQIQRDTLVALNKGGVIFTDDNLHYAEKSNVISKLVQHYCFSCNNL